MLLLFLVINKKEPQKCTPPLPVLTNKISTTDYGCLKSSKNYTVRSQHPNKRGTKAGMRLPINGKRKMQKIQSPSRKQKMATW